MELCESWGWQIDTDRCVIFPHRFGLFHMNHIRQGGGTICVYSGGQTGPSMAQSRSQATRESGKEEETKSGSSAGSAKVRYLKSRFDTIQPDSMQFSRQFSRISETNGRSFLHDLFFCAGWAVVRWILIGAQAHLKWGWIFKDIFRVCSQSSGFPGKTEEVDPYLPPKKLRLVSVM